MTYERDPNLDIRGPDLRGVRRTGTVRWFKDDKGYGRITADDGEVLWVHFSHIEVKGFASLKEGQKVSFVWNGGIQDHGRHRAEGVRPVDARAVNEKDESRGDSGAWITGGFVIKKVGKREGHKW